MNDESNFSGLFVNADGIMHEGEPTRWLETVSNGCVTADCQPLITSKLALTLNETQITTNKDKNVGPFYLNYRNGYIDVDAGSKICNR